MKFEEVMEPKKTIYIARKLVNAEDVIAWAKDNGFVTCLKPDDFHATVFYTKNKVNWYDVEPLNDIVVVESNGLDRSICLLGKSALCLTFKDDYLEDRHYDLRHTGLISSFNEYLQHVTLSYREYDQPNTIMSIKPYSGPLIFGPEFIDHMDHPGGGPEFEEIPLNTWQRGMNYE